MSAVLVVQRPDVIHVITDAAFYDEAGVLLYAAPKVFPIGDLSAVFTSRGSSKAFPAFSEAVERVAPDSFDGFLERLADVFATYDAIMAEIGEPDDAGEIVIAGFSEASGEPFVLWRPLASCRWHPEIEAGKTYRMSGRLFLGGDPETLPEAKAFDRAAGVAAMEAARLVEHDLTCGAGAEPVMGYCIGGFIAHAEIRPDGGSIEMAHDWRDPVGELIRPTQPLAAAA